jgi:predicted NBD/HSP70 family sugar kinase
MNGVPYEETVSGEGMGELEAIIDRTLASAPAGWLRQPSTAQVHRVVDRVWELEHTRYAVGVELLPYRAVAVLCDESGARLGDTQCTVPVMTPDDVVRTVARLTRELVTEHLGFALPNPRVSIGLHLAGPVDARAGLVQYYHKRPYNRFGATPEFVWQNVPLAAMLTEATGLAAAVENDANSLAIYQQWFGAGRDVSGFGLILLRDGVGGSLVVNHQLFDGPFEIGNLVVYPEGGRTCDCGNEGCLEVTAGCDGVLSTARTFAETDIASAAEAAALVNGPEEAGLKVQDAFRAAGIAIAKGLGFVVTLVAPPRMVLYCPTFLAEAGTRAADTFLHEVRKFRRYVSHEAFRDCDLVVTPLRPFEGAHAGCLVALERCFGVGPGQLVTA